MKESYYKEQLPEAEKKEYQECVDLMERGSRKKTAKKLEEFLDEKPNFVPALNKMAVIHIYRKELNQAQSLLNQILEQDPDFAPAVTNLGSIAKEMGNLKRAKKLYQKAIAIDEEYGPAYNNLGVIYREEGNYSESIKHLKKARKKGSFSYHLNADKPFYKDPGCLFVIFLVVSLILVLYLLLT
ncbi:tetratricopeptide repeat protein [Halanaerobium saccharolyticum]|uniref:Tetratricopeptide repeat protein n=1 Tax=Halanaerobium saccharolyticum TaxID=43595 RepID=A0A4R7YQI9_9FIRM|nr:tetratricopeptide repeat protein [Halanaerobium saccharolyticum]RAK05447.1 tetratricopeptide repeat protein [Halanaerobium saccharolyticum]TDV99782.1 tetratricopeptide repeat protein [Halanaerobium saccharolyticum]TDX52004.1 tetratricopeptide repeat protein [Halanaerobium saccharolyticum]